MTHTIKYDIYQRYQKYLEGFEMWCWSQMEISSTNCVKNEEVLYSAQEERNILCTVTRRKANWNNHILCRNCLLKHIIEGKIKEQKWQEDKEEDVCSYWITLRK
jgi:hypothetical protein